ncbi:hypothetical protein Tco_1342575, partial [Tanacetum coccineum]
WLEHEFRDRKKFEGKCAMQANLLKERDAEIASLKAQLCLKEAEATKAIRLRGQVAAIEAVEAAWVSELDGLKERNVALEGQVATLESAATTCSELHYEVSGYKLFKEQIEAAYDEKVKVLSDRIAEWILCRGFKLAVMKCLQSLKYLAVWEQRFIGLCTLYIRSRLVGDGGRWGWDSWLGTDLGALRCWCCRHVGWHEKSERGLVDVAAYNPSAEANYISIVNALHAVDFHLLAQLESYKDASIADILDLLHLEGPAAKTPKASQLQPSSEQLMLPIYLLEDQVLSISDALVPLIEPLSVENLVGEASTFRVPAMITTTALSTTFTGSTPSVSVVDYEVSGARPSTEVSSPLKIMFEKEELETTLEHTTVD